MQDLATDQLTSKRIPTIGPAYSFQRMAVNRIAAAINLGSNRHVADDSAVVVAKPAAAISHVVSPMTVELSRTYSGWMTISGSLSATSNQTGKWSGALHETLAVTVDRAGNGTGYEIFSGNITLTVTNPDGSKKSSGGPIAFSTLDFTLQKGKFVDSESSGLDFDDLMMSLNLKGSFGASQTTINQQLSLPIDGVVNDVLVSGSLHGSSSVTTGARMTISGAMAEQTALTGKGVKPFRGLWITDLNNAAITATVTLSNAKNGTLTNLAGGKYNRAKGTYTITGTEVAINSALRGLMFDPTGRSGSTSSHITTSFRISATDTAGASQNDRTTSVVGTDPMSIQGTVSLHSATGTKAFTLLPDITISDFSGNDGNDYVKVTMSNPANGSFENLDGGYYNKKKGVYIISASQSAADAALRGLKFQPSAGPSGKTGDTSFTILVINAAGASATVKTTIVDKPAKTGTAVDAAVGLFSQHIAAGFDGTPGHVEMAIPAVHDGALSSHFEIAASHR